VQTGSKSNAEAVPTFLSSFSILGLTTGGGFTADGSAPSPSVTAPAAAPSEPSEPARVKLGRRLRLALPALLQGRDAAGNRSAAATGGNAQPPLSGMFSKGCIVVEVFFLRGGWRGGRGEGMGNGRSSRLHLLPVAAPRTPWLFFSLSLSSGQ
jgi:hypothetical protein